MRFLHCNFRYVCLEGSYGRHPSVSAQPGYGPNQPVGNHTYGNNMAMGYSRMNQSVYPQHYGHQQNSGHVPMYGYNNQNINMQGGAMPMSSSSSLVANEQAVAGRGMQLTAGGQPPHMSPMHYNTSPAPAANPNASVPGSQASVPGSQSSIPGSNASVPGQQGSVPGQHSSVPGTHAPVPRPHTPAPGPQGPMLPQTSVSDSSSYNAGAASHAALSEQHASPRASGPKGAQAAAHAAMMAASQQNNTKNAASTAVSTGSQSYAPIAAAPSASAQPYVQHSQQAAPQSLNPMGTPYGYPIASPNSSSVNSSMPGNSCHATNKFSQHDNYDPTYTNRDSQYNSVPPNAVAPESNCPLPNVPQSSVSQRSTAQESSGHAIESRYDPSVSRNASTVTTTTQSVLEPIMNSSIAAVALQTNDSAAPKPPTPITTKPESIGTDDSSQDSFKVTPSSKPELTKQVRNVLFVFRLVLIVLLLVDCGAETCSELRRACSSERRTTSWSGSVRWVTSLRDGPSCCSCSAS